jgi:hypothetical protein
MVGRGRGVLDRVDDGTGADAVDCHEAKSRS